MSTTAMFKKFTVYTLMREIEVQNFQSLVAALSTYKPRQLKATEESFSGFTAALPRVDSPVAWFSSSGVELGDIDTITLRELGGPNDMLLLNHYYETKVILSQYVKRQVEARAASLSNQLGRPATRGERAEFRHEIIASLMLRAQTRVITTPILFTGKGLVLIGAHGKQAETASSALRQVLGTLPLTPANPVRTPEAVLTERLKAEYARERDPESLGEPVDDFKINLDFQFSTQGGGRCRASGITWEDRVDDLLQEAKVSHAALSYKDFTDFKLDNSARVSSVKFHNIYSEEGETEETEDATERSDHGRAYVELSQTVELASAIFDQLLGGLEPHREFEPDAGPTICSKFEAARWQVVVRDGDLEDEEGNQHED